jgi:trans-2-enoyl-CoA reductase
MIEDFQKPARGGWIIQNGANSGVGRAVIQLCKAEGIRTVNIIRDRQCAEEVRNDLLALGGDAVFTSSQRGEIEQFCRENTPRLAFNMVGGRDTIQLLKCLGEKSSLVTYGAMSNSPMSVPFGLQVFKDITLHSYWMTRWSKKHARTDKEDEMFGKLAGYFQSGELTPTPHRENSFYDFSDALDNAFKVKQLFVVDKTLSDSRHLE